MTTKIEWVARPGTTPETWNPVTGCDKVSGGCKNCYAERMAKRLAGRFGYPADEPFRVTLHPDRLEKPLKWKKPRTVFVCSMGDLFHEDVHYSYIYNVWRTMNNAQAHTFMVLTKRPERMAKVVAGFIDSGEFDAASNVWLGTTIELPNYCYRAEYLRKTPATVRFLSLEPLLASFADYPGVIDDMDWVIVGGESGPGARPVHPDWIRSVRDQCQAADVPFFFKQWGAWGDHHRTHGMGYHSVPVCVACGSVGNCIDRDNAECDCQAGTHLMRLVGKKRAGRRLDRREWNEWPK